MMHIKESMLLAVFHEEWQKKDKVSYFLMIREKRFLQKLKQFLLPKGWKKFLLKKLLGAKSLTSRVLLMQKLEIRLLTQVILLPFLEFILKNQPLKFLLVQIPPHLLEKKGNFQTHGKFLRDLPK